MMMNENNENVNCFKSRNKILFICSFSETIRAIVSSCDLEDLQNSMKVYHIQ
jgi:hypothetical protein